MTTEEKLIASIGIPVSLVQENINGHRINYAVAGNGPPMLLIHGANFGWGVWYPNIPEFAEHFTVYAIDLPGAGRSSGIDYKAFDPRRDFVDIVNKFIELKKLKDISIVGHSIGGWVAAQVAASQGKNVKKTILLDSVGFSRKPGFVERILSVYPIASFIARTILVPKRENKKLESFLRSSFYAPKTELRPEFIDYFYESMGRSHNLLFLSRLVKLNKELFLGNTSKFGKENLLIIWGSHDKILPLKRSGFSVRSFSGNDAVLVPYSGHVPSVEQPAVFNKIVLDFLNA